MKMAASGSSGAETISSTNLSGQNQDQHGPPGAKTTPKDALVMASILKEMGVNEYEPRIINQMLEFTYRYVTDVLEDAKVYSGHASKKLIDLDDVKLAIERRLDHSFTSPPPRELLLEIARQKNSQPLPLISEKSGLRLPPDRYCLTSNNFKTKSGAAVAKKSAHLKGSAKESVHSNKSHMYPPQGMKPLLLADGAQNAKPFHPAAHGLTTPDGSVISPMGNLQVTIKQEASSDDAFAGAPHMTRPSAVSTISSLPSMEETTASAQQFSNLLKRKREEDEEDYDT